MRDPIEFTNRIIDGKALPASETGLYLKQVTSFLEEHGVASFEVIHPDQTGARGCAIISSFEKTFGRYDSDPYQESLSIEYCYTVTRANGQETEQRRISMTHKTIEFGKIKQEKTRNYDFLNGVLIISRDTGVIEPVQAELDKLNNIFSLSSLRKIEK